MESVLNERFTRIFGELNEPMTELETRARKMLPDEKWILWEGDPQTFAFSFIGGDSEELLGYASEDWIRDPSFWSTHIVHPDDRDDAIAYCALATGRRLDHIFEYRALSKEGKIVWLQDFVRVAIGPRNLPIHLRGIMINITDEKEQLGTHQNGCTFFQPSIEELQTTVSTS